MKRKIDIECPAKITLRSIFRFCTILIISPFRRGIMCFVCSFRREHRTPYYFKYNRTYTRITIDYSTKSKNGKTFNQPTKHLLLVRLVHGWSHIMMTRHTTTTTTWRFENSALQIDGCNPPRRQKTTALYHPPAETDVSTRRLSHNVAQIHDDTDQHYVEHNGVYLAGYILIVIPIAMILVILLNIYI